MTAWTDRIAANLLHLEADLRRTLREASRGGRPSRLTGFQRIEISVAEARTVLHGVMPAPIATKRLRKPHARLVAALATFDLHLIRLNDVEADRMVQLLNTLDSAARTWARHAHRETLFGVVHG